MSCHLFLSSLLPCRWCPVYFTAHLLACGKCVSSCVLYSSVGGPPRERKTGTELSRDAVFFVLLFSSSVFFFFSPCASSRSPSCSFRGVSAHTVHLTSATITAALCCCSTCILLTSLSIIRVLCRRPGCIDYRTASRVRREKRLTGADGQSESRGFTSWSHVTR